MKIFDQKSDTEEPLILFGDESDDEAFSTDVEAVPLVSRRQSLSTRDLRNRDSDDLFTRPHEDDDNDDSAREAGTPIRSPIDQIMYFAPFEDGTRSTLAVSKFTTSGARSESALFP